ncbi:hypothetical protein Tco_0279206, partial [Tanacetum coccineum]
MLAIAAAGNDAADEENAAAHEAAGSTAEAHPEPHSHPVSPVREPTPERQPETEWVVPNPVSPVTDWRPWPSVPAHSPIRDPSPEPAGTRRGGANLSADGLPHTAVSESAGPSIATDKGKAPMPELDIPAEFVAEDAQAR